MEKLERQNLIAELRKHHEATFTALHIPHAYFAAKYPHVPEGMDEKHIGLYPSECSKGDNIYVECVDMKYKPLDTNRRLYMWKHNPDFATMYKMKKEQYLIPVSELNIVNPIHDNRVQSKVKSVIEQKYNDDIPISEMTIRDYFAITHRTPVSNKKLVNDLINQINNK